MPDKTELPEGFRVGPSGIKRVSKFLNRHHKAANHRANALAQATRNREHANRSTFKK